MQAQQKQQIKALLQQALYADALALLTPILNDKPHERDALYFSAVCYRLLKQFSSAQQSILTLITHYPEYAIAFQELGHIHRDAGESDKALSAYQHGVNLNPTLLGAWQQLAKLYKQFNDTDNVQQVQQQIQELRALPPPILKAKQALYAGQVKVAEDLTRQFLQHQPLNTAAMRLLAQIATQLYVLDDAQVVLEKAIKLAPNDLYIRLDLIHVLQKRQRYTDAIAFANDGLALHANNPYLYLALAMQYTGISEFDDAKHYFGLTLAGLPSYAPAFLQRGHLYKMLGEIDLAIDDYLKGIALKPDFGDAYWSLANLKTYRFNHNTIAQMQGMLSHGYLSAVDKYHIAFALGKAFEDKQDFDAAFEYYALGNDTKRSLSRYDAAQVSQEMQQQIASFPVEVFSHVQGCTASDPIFIVGLPRAGSTLIEQILASHPQIEGTSELPYIIGLSRQLNKHEAGYPEALRHLSDDECHSLGERYLEQAQAHRHLDSPYFIDKMPNNFRHLGLIHKILPKAKIIDARREPMSCCFSGYKQLFAEGQEFSYDLNDIAQYYQDYVNLMQHWQTCFSDNILLVNHEDVVSDLESSVKSMLAFLDLPFAEQCLTFHKTERAIKTPSAEQVRQPINPQSNEAWRKFEKHLGVLKTHFLD